MNNLSEEVFDKWMRETFRPPPEKQQRIFFAPNVGIYMKLGPPVQVSRDCETWADATADDLQAINRVMMIDINRAKKIMNEHLNVIKN